MRHLVGAVLRGLRARAALSAGSVVLMVLAIGSAVLGPAFATAVTNSYVVTRITQTAPSLTGVTWRFTPAEDVAPDRAGELAREGAGELLARPFGASRSWSESVKVATLGASAQFWHRADVCASLDVEGACPQAPGEALLLARDLERLDAEIGDTIALERTRDPNLQRAAGTFASPGVPEITVVGSYVTPPTATHWLSPEHLIPTAEFNTEQKFRPYLTAPIFVDAPTLAAMARWTTTVEAPFVAPADLDADDLERATAIAAEVPAAADGAAPLQVAGGTLQSIGLSDLANVTADTEQQRRTAQSSIAPAVLSLVLVALTLLLRLLSSASELRMPEIALASLRGLGSRRLWMYGLGEPLLLLALAVPLGLAAGAAASLGLVRAWLVPGLPVPWPWVSSAAVLLVVLAAASVAAFAVGRVVSTSLSGQLSGVRRPVAARRWSLVGQLSLVAVTLAILLSKLTADAQAEPDVTDLVLPVLLAVVAGLAATRLIAFVAAWWSRRPERGTGSMTWFVASRAVARRQEGTLVILPVTAAIAVGVFGLGVYDSAADWRTSVAATKAPAHTVWASPMSLGETHDYTQRVDPEGDHLMAASDYLSVGANFSVVDSERLAAVAAWPPSWGGGRTVEEVAEAIEMPGEVPVVRGRTLSVTVDNQLRGGAELNMELRWGSAESQPRRSYGGPFGPGLSTVTVDLPGCAEQGCPLEGITFGGGAGTAMAMDGRFVVTQWEVDGLAIDPVTGSAWLPSPSAGIPSAISATEVVGDDIVVDVSSADGAGMARLSSAGLPRFRPVLRGAGVSDRIEVDLSDGVTAVPVEFVGTVAGTPFTGRVGMLVDLVAFTNDRQYFDSRSETRVLSTADLPVEMREELSADGFSVVTTLAAEREILDQGAYAMALRLYAIVAALALLTALAGVLLSNAMQLPARRRDAAALRVVGVPRRTVARAVTRELGVVLGGAALAGVLAGTLAQWIVLRSLTLGEVSAAWMPELVVSLTPMRAAGLALGAVAVLWVVALTAARATVRGANGATLRESAR